MIVVGQEFIGGVKAEGVTAMLRQNALSDWAIEEVQEKVTKAHAPPKEAAKSKSKFITLFSSYEMKYYIGCSKICLHHSYFIQICQER